MRKVSIVGFALLAVTVGCSFHVGSEPEPVAPQGPHQTPAVTPHPTATAPAAPRSGTVQAIGRKKVPGAVDPAPSPGTAPTTPPVTPPPASGIPIMTGANLFGIGTPDATGWKGSFFAIPAGTQKVPALASMTPTGILFAHALDVTAKPMSGGFPGIDANRNENFAIRWEAPLIVDNEADYTFRIVSDDGAIVSIDGTLIVDNDGAHGVTEKSGPVHLVKGTHGISVDYFQTTGGVALQLFCKKAGANETICPTRL